MYKGTVLALDLATVTGWAAGKPGTVPTFGHVRFMRPGMSRAAGYRELRGWLDMTMHQGKVDLIVFESPAVPSIMAGKTNIDTIKLLIGLAENLEEWSYNHIELREASVSQVRSHFIGQNMKAAIAKPMTMQRCRTLGWNVATTDEADACALWDYQCCHLRPDLAASGTPLFSGLK
jgi:crossover junction endodeoxyribonuclease RuvC